jgi:molybdopterin converting factor small subunit
MDASTLTTSTQGETGAVARITLRLFAAARQVAGTAKLPLEALTVADALAQASERFGPAFAAVAAASRTWVNGEPAAADRPLSSGDELAVLPPVSGGAG